MGKLDRRRALKLRFRRTLRLQRRQVEELGAVAEQHLEDDFFKRLERLGSVRRFISSWILLLVLLIGLVVSQTRALSGYYKTLQPEAGGTYTEGVLGQFTDANPIYATSLADTTVSHLIFSGLFTYNQQNQLIGDLAQSWSVDSSDTVYTVHLRPGLTWQDGQPLTSADVLFTYQVIQNADAGSPLYNSFQDVTVAAPDPLTVTFTIPDPLASFPYSLTNGIIPKHLLGGTAMADMRSVSFNTTKPVGSGPFEWQGLEVEGDTDNNTGEVDIALRPFNNYHLGRPKLDDFVVRSFQSSDELVSDFKNDQLNAVAGLDQIPDSLKNDTSMHVYNMPLTAAVMAFFDTAHGVTSDLQVRQALEQSVDVSSIISSLGYPTLPVREPLLHGQLGYNPNYEQSPYDLANAEKTLDADGWTVGKDGVRYKDGQPLTIALYYQDSTEYSSVAKQLLAYWHAVGIQTTLVGQSPVDFQSTLSQAPSQQTSSYDVLLYGISIGVDPDVYVYWDSSQIDLRSPTRLNFSAFDSSQADESLEAGRTRLDPALRTIKYVPFLEAWQSDVPALGLYQPRFLYLTRGTVYGLNESPINSDAQRFDNVQNWEIREVRKS